MKMFSTTPFYVKYPFPEQHFYKGYCLPGKHVCSKQEEFQKIRDFPIRYDDVAIISYLRTGSRWTAERVSWICSGCDEDFITNSSILQRVVRLEWIEPRISTDMLSNLPMTSPRVFASHLPRDLAPADIDKAKIIIPIRNPKDNVVSFYHLFQIYKTWGPYKGPWEDFLQGYMDGSLLWGSYFDWLKGWWPLRHNDNVMFLKYEDSKKDPVKMVRKIADFLGKPLSEEQVQLIVKKTDFTAMKNSPQTNVSRDQFYAEKYDQEVIKTVEVINKGEVGQWKNYFTVRQNEDFEKLINEKLANNGIDFEFEYEL